MSDLNGNGTDGSGSAVLKTIRDGDVPLCRMSNAAAVVDWVRRLIKNDDKRSKKRSLVDGLVDGNAPLNWRKLRDANRADACNVNWGTARANMEAAVSAYYDLFCQAPGFVEIETSHGTHEKRGQYSRTMSLHADQIIREDSDFDNDMQLSQMEMVLHGDGPLYFENEHAVFPMAVETGDLLVPDRTRSKMSRWEAAVVLWDYYPPELYRHIANAEAATKVGWRVEYTKRCIEKAMNLNTPDGAQRTWEDYQREVKNNSLTYVGDDTKITRAAHVFWREFPENGDQGRVTHAIVERTGQQSAEYLFIKIGRYENFEQALHSMYYDKGRGGYHHSVTGQGVKLYGPLEYENRLLGNLMDKAFAPKLFFKPSNAEAKEKVQMVRFSDYGVVPPGTEAIQIPVQGSLVDGLAMFRTSSDLMRSNLSAYRQPSEMARPGNPETAFKEKMNATEQGALSNTAFNRYYRQLDALYGEIVRRLCNPNTTDDRAKKFQRLCKEDGVPAECFGRIRAVRACRVMGQGSPFMRATVTGELAQVITRCSQEGQDNWLNDFIAARAGQAAVNRYNPQADTGSSASDQRFLALAGVAMAKEGVPPIVSSSQNPMVFAGTYLKAATDALNSVQQGGNPKQVLAFIHVLAPSLAQHIKRIEQDPLRKQVAAALMQRLKKLGALVDKLQKMLQQQAQKQKGQQQKTQQTMSDLQLKNMKVRGELSLKAQKQKHGMALKAAQVRQNLLLSDARVASEIRNNRLRAFND